MSIGSLIRIWVLVNLLLAAIFPLGAYAGFVDFECQTNHLWNFDSASVELNLWENIKIVGCDELLMHGATDSDPTFHITETITNNSGLSWAAYELTLSGTGVSFDYITNPPSSDHFQSFKKDGTTPTTRFTFNSPSDVPNGDKVKLGFDIKVDTTGLFRFTLTQNPLTQNLIPEPATICLLGLGALSLIHRKR